MDIVKTFNSSAINRINYSSRNKELTVTFTSGGTYIYENVPHDVITNWIRAESKGKYFHKYIKKYSSNIKY